MRQAPSSRGWAQRSSRHNDADSTALRANVAPAARELGESLLPGRRTPPRPAPRRRARREWSARRAAKGRAAQERSGTQVAWSRRTQRQILARDPAPIAHRPEGAPAQPLPGSVQQPVAHPNVERCTHGFAGCALQTSAVEQWRPTSSKEHLFAGCVRCVLPAVRQLGARRATPPGVAAFKRAAAGASGVAKLLGLRVCQIQERLAVPDVYQRLRPQIADDQLFIVRRVAATGHAAVREQVQRLNAHFAQQTIRAVDSLVGGRGLGTSYTELIPAQTSSRKRATISVSDGPSRINLMWDDRAKLGSI